MSAAQALCFHAAAAEAAGQPLPGPTFAERDILSRLRATDPTDQSDQSDQSDLSHQSHSSHSSHS